MTPPERQQPIVLPDWLLMEVGRLQLENVNLHRAVIELAPTQPPPPPDPSQEVRQSAQGFVVPDSAEQGA